MKKILIIGSQGYLGSRLTDYLQEKGYDCTGADIGFFKYGVFYYPKTVRFLNKSAYEITKNDLKGQDVVIQLAGISNDPFSNLDPNSIYDPTRDYSRQIAIFCKELGVRYIFPSSCSVYGIGEEHLDEDGPTKPQTAYSLNKLQIEEDLTLLSDKDFSPIALRLATVFGNSPRIRFDVVVNMLCGMAVSQKKIILNSNGKSWRPHLYIDDVCEAFRCCIDWDYDEGKLMIMNLGRNDNNWRIIDVARLIQQEVKGCELEFINQKTNNKIDDLVIDRKTQDGVDKRTYRVNFDRIERLLPNFEAKWDVKSGVRQLIKDLKSLFLDEVKFKQRDFYRLQQIEYLIKTKQIRF